MPFKKEDKPKNHLGFNRLYARGQSTLGFIRGVPVAKQSDAQPGDLLISVDHKRQVEYMVRVLQNPNPLNVTLIHFEVVQTKNLKRKGLVVREVKNLEPACVQVSQLGYREFWHAQQRKLAA